MASVENLLVRLQADDFIRSHIAHQETLAAHPGMWAEFPEWLHPALRAALARQGTRRLYQHQRQACDLAQAGRDVLIVTPTASGKSLGCHLPVLNRLLRDPQACALYLSPTKALAQDQYQALQRLATDLPPELGLLPEHIALYDGDTPASARPAIRRTVRLLISNPDLLHFALLPSHEAWHRFLSGLDFTVVDEIHAYRGVFGSHVANVFRRLQRLRALHAPQRPVQFLGASATVANEEELARTLLGRPMALVKRNGAPRGARHVLFFNPPPLPNTAGWRDAPGAVCRLERLCRAASVQSLIFARTRMEVERLVTDLRHQAPQAEQAIHGYRGGYLPQQRRAVEKGLRDGSIATVVSTNALELGIDIGLLQCVILMRYPGTIASAWQQIGRAGRRQETSVALFVASHNPLDQYLIGHPEFLFERAPEYALLNPDHPRVLLQHLECALEEHAVAPHLLPQDVYGQGELMAGALAYLRSRQRAFQKQGSWFYMGAAYPAGQVSLRNIGHAVTIATAASGSDAAAETLGTLEEEAADAFLHPGAIYLHQGRKYRVDALDYRTRQATVTPVPGTDMHTEAVSLAEIEVQALQAQERVAGAVAGYGDVEVRFQVVGYRKMRRFRRGAGMAQEPLGVEELDCPLRAFPTQAYWVQVPRATQQRLEQSNLWRDSRNDYGPSWQAQRRKARQRYGTACSRCGRPERPDRAHDVHHVRPFRMFGYVPGQNRHDELANALENLRILCRACHRLMEPLSGRGARGLSGLAQALRHIAPFHLMCDPADLGAEEVLARGPGTPRAPAVRVDFDPALATIFVYERFVGGLGFSQALFRLHARILRNIAGLIRDCACDQGCPACVGPTEADAEDLLGAGITRKALTQALLDSLLEETDGAG